MSRNDSCNSQHTLDQQSPQTPVHASCLKSKASTPHICPCRHCAPQTSKLKPHAVMAVHPGSRTDHNCTPRSSHAIYLRTCTSPSPHHVCIQNNKCVSPAPGVILAAELVLALQADPSLPHAPHARWFTASRCVSLCVAHSLVMAPLLLSMKSAIAAVTSVSSSSSKSPSAMW